MSEEPLPPEDGPPSFPSAGASVARTFDGVAASSSSAGAGAASLGVWAVGAGAATGASADVDGATGVGPGAGVGADEVTMGIVVLTSLEKPLLFAKMS